MIRHLEGTRFSIGEPSGELSPAGAPEFSNAMVAGDLTCPVEADLRQDIWVKLMGNVAFNPNKRPRAGHDGGHLPPRRRPRSCVETMMEETVAVAQAVGCDPHISIERRLAGAEKAGEHKTSTLQDLEKGKPLELDVLLAAVVELADLTGTSVPTSARSTPSPTCSTPSARLAGAA